jgi:acyl-CoA thioesterase FadM
VPHADRTELVISREDVGPTLVLTTARTAFHVEKAVQALAKRAMVTRQPSDEEHGEMTMPGELPQVQRVAFEIVRFEMEQIAAVKLGEQAALEVTLDRMGRTSVQIDFRILRPADYRTCVQGRLSLVAVEPATRKPREIPQRLRIALLGIADEPDVPA